MDSLFTYLLKSAGCLALFYGFYWVFLRRETSFALNRVYLVSAACLSIVLPLIKMTSPFFTTVVVSHPLDFGAAGPPIPGSSPSMDPLRIVFFVYLGGAALFFFRFTIQLFGLFRIARECGCERHDGLKVVFCGRRGEPFSFFNVIFLDRSRIVACDLDRILTHEMAHVRQLHSLDIILSELLTVIQWFNPFVWPYKRSLRETHEYLADRAVIAQGCSLARYQLLIVEQHVGGELFELASNFRNSQIKRRLMMLSKTEAKGLARLKPLLILPLALVLVLAFAESRTVVQAPGPAAVAAQEKGGGPPSAQEKSEEEVARKIKQAGEKLEQVKKDNDLKISDIKAMLEKTNDPAEKEKLMQLLNQEKIKSVEISMKARSLSMKKLELALAKETDAAKRDELKKKLEQLKVENEESALKLGKVKQDNQSAEKKSGEKK
jgi:hypothetical protein